MGICSLPIWPGCAAASSGGSAAARPGPVPFSRKIAIPLTDTNEFSPHYGASARFEVFEVEPAQRAVLRRTIVAPAEAEPCAWAPLLRAAGVELVLAGGMGAGARHHMAEQGIEVVAGVPAAPPDELVTAWLENRLVRGDNACDGQGHHPHHGDKRQFSGSSPARCRAST